MANWYTTRELVKRALNLEGISRDALIDRHIAAASDEVEKLLGRRFIPLTKTRNFPWPQTNGKGGTLYLDDDLLAVTALTKEGDDTTAIAATGYFLEPVSQGPPYTRIEIDRSTTEAFEQKDTSQRAIRVTGRWAYSEDTEAAGTVASGLAASESAASFVCSDASLIGVGDMLLIESEQLFVSEKGTADTTANLASDLTAASSETAVTVNDGTKVNAGEVILLDSERMYVESVSDNVAIVERAYDGTALAAHTGAVDVYAFRTLTVARGQNGTTAATHADATSISRYVAPGPVIEFVTALAINRYSMESGGWTGALGGSEAAIEARGVVLKNLKEEVVANFGRLVGGF